MGAGNSVLPHLIESDPSHKGMNIRLDQILPDKNLLGEKIVLIEIRHIISELFESLQSAAGVLGFWGYEQVDIEGAPSIPMHGKRRRSDDNELDAMSA